MVVLIWRLWIYVAMGRVLRTPSSLAIASTSASSSELDVMSNIYIFHYLYKLREIYMSQLLEVVCWRRTQAAPWLQKFLWWSMRIQNIVGQSGTIWTPGLLTILSVACCRRSTRPRGILHLRPHQWLLNLLLWRLLQRVSLLLLSYMFY